MGISAVVGGALVSSYMSSEAASDAADTQAQAANEAARLQKETSDAQLALQKQIYEEDRARQEKIYQENVARQEPWYQAGQNALQRLQTGIAPGGEFDQKFSGITEDPSYKFRFNEGQRALEASAAARGSLFTAGQMDALASRGQDMASQEYQAAYNRFANERAFKIGNVQNLAGAGQNTANQLAGMGQNYTNAMSNMGSQYAGTASNTMGTSVANQNAYRTDAAAANAAGIIGKTNAWTNMIDQGVGLYKGGITGGALNKPTPNYNIANGQQYVPQGTYSDWSLNGTKI